MDSTFVKWLCIVAASIAVLSAIGTGWWYLEEDRLLNKSWFADDKEWNEKIIAKQEKLHEEHDEILRTLSYIEGWIAAQKVK